MESEEEAVAHDDGLLGCARISRLRRGDMFQRRGRRFGDKGVNFYDEVRGIWDAKKLEKRTKSPSQPCIGTRQRYHWSLYPKRELKIR